MGARREVEAHEVAARTFAKSAGRVRRLGAPVYFSVQHRRFPEHRVEYQYFTGPWERVEANIQHRLGVSTGFKVIRDQEGKMRFKLPRTPNPPTIDRDFKVFDAVKTSLEKAKLPGWRRARLE